ISLRSTLERNSDRHKSLTKQIKKRIRYLRNQQLQKEADEIDTRSQRREIEELYRSFKNDNSAFQNVKTEVKCDPVKLKEYFVNHFNTVDLADTPVELENAPEFVKRLQDISIEGISSAPPTKDEIIDTLKILKAYKSANDIPIAYIKYALDCGEVLEEMEKLYEIVWRLEKTPVDWSHSRLVTLWKGADKGLVTDPKTYRGIQVGSTMCKIMVTIILRRLNAWYNAQLSDQQQGFRQGRGTTDGIFLVKRVQQISRKTGKQVYALFVDLTAAFDHVNRNWMFKSVNQRLSPGTNAKLFKLLESIYTYTSTALSQDEKQKFEISTGVRQGGPEAPTLYNLYMDYVMRVFVKTCKQSGIKFFTSSYSIPRTALTSKNRFQLGKYGDETIDWIGYADDLVLLFPDKQNLIKGLDILNTTLQRYQLQINFGKTKTMIMNFSGGEYPQSIANVNGVDIENVEVFRYLGCQIHYNQVGTGDEELNLRADSAVSRFYALSKKFFNHKIALPVRVKIMNALVRTRLTYGCPTWCLTKRQTERMNAVYMSILRKMTRGGFRRKENTHRFVYTNRQIYEICQTTTLDDYIAKQQRAYLAHIIREDDEIRAKKILFDAEENRLPGRFITLFSTVSENDGCSKNETIERAMKKIY
ncbi:MAG: reverse transcriptase family protein, partial [Candidatus Poseidoniia archaeon]